MIARKVSDQTDPLGSQNASTASDAHENPSRREMLGEGRVNACAVLFVSLACRGSFQATSHVSAFPEWNPRSASFDGEPQRLKRILPLGLSSQTDFLVIDHWRELLLDRQMGERSWLLRQIK
jgi:hypothetical protein